MWFPPGKEQNRLEKDFYMGSIEEYLAKIMPVLEFSPKVILIQVGRDKLLRFRRIR